MQDSAGPHFILSGYRDGISLYLQSTYGFYWSSSAHTSATNAYNLRLGGTPSSVTPANFSSERGGFSLRCLAQ